MRAQTVDAPGSNVVSTVALVREQDCVRPRRPPNPQKPRPSPSRPPPLAATVRVVCPTAQDWADFGEWCAKVGLRNRDEVDAHRELEYLDMMDAGL